MPERPLAHQIESESRRAFEALLGSLFVYRPDNPDYGIDGTVEQFGEDNKSTGLRYYVQLKATAGEDLGKAFTRSIPIETATLYGALDLPLLMVGYRAASKQLYARWWHNRLPGKRPPKPNPASITFCWSEDDIAAPDAPRDWASEARVFLDLRFSSLPIPLRLGLNVEEPPFGLTAAEIEIAVKGQMKNRPDIVEFRREDLEGMLRVVGSLLTIEMPGVTAASYELGNQYPTEEAGEQLAIDLMALLAAAFVHWGQVDLAARMTSSFFAGSTLAGNPELAILLASVMTRARRLPEALAVAEDIDARVGLGESNTSVFFTLTSRQHSASLTKAEARDYERAMRRRIKRREEAGAAIEASREMVSLANHYRNKQEPDPAIDLLERAAELDPEYRERGHYWHELGGVLFFAKRFEESAEAYAKAVELGESGMTTLLHADALLFAGRYTAAREAFRESIDDIESFGRGSEYYLKIGLLDFVIDWRGVEVQKRTPAAATQLVGEVIPDDGSAAGEEAIADKCWEALGADALNGLAWWNLASAVEKLGEREQAGLMFLNAALCQPWDAEAWAFAFTHLWREGRVDVLPMILVTGERVTQHKVLPTINALVTQHMEPEDRGELISKLSEIVDELADPRSDGFELRFVNSGKKVESMIIPGAATRRE